MSDRPWLEDGDPSLRTERELLKRLNGRQPPVGSVEQGWATLAADISGLGLPLADPSHAAAAHTAGSSASLGVLAKVALGVAVAGGMAWGGSQLLSGESKSPSLGQRAPISVAPSALVARPETEPEALPVEAPGGDVQPPQSAARPAASATTLAEEGRQLAKAHQLVQAGKAGEALEVLRKSASLYPRSALYQEREVLTIEALSATGAGGAARQRAERFLKRYPSSPHSGRLQRFVE